MGGGDYHPFTIYSTTLFIVCVGVLVVWCVQKDPHGSYVECGGLVWVLGLSVEVNPDGVGGVSGVGFCDAFAVFDDGDACTGDGEFGNVEFAEVCDV